MNYRSFNDLNKVILKNLYKFPRDIFCIVGVPRSGMLVANLLSLYLNIPFTDIDSFINNRIYGNGHRSIINNKSNKVLIVDDSILTGNSLSETKNKLKNLQNKYNFKYCAIYATKESYNFVDLYCELIEYPRVFQWNLFNHWTNERSCFDLDGVLCVDPPIDDGEKYINYISDAIPLYIPYNTIHTIITCRLEKYREITEKWLLEHNIKYNNLIMLNFKTRNERLKWGKHGIWKGELYKKQDDCILFIESDLNQAKQIFNVSHKPVICTKNFEIIQ